MGAAAYGSADSLRSALTGSASLRAASRPTPFAFTFRLDWSTP